MNARVLVTSLLGREPSTETTNLSREKSIELVFPHDYCQPLNSDQLIETLNLVGPVSGIVAGRDRINEDVIDVLRKRSSQSIGIHRAGVGVDSIDIDAARKSGVPVTFTKGSNQCATAEYTLALMLLSLHRVQDGIEALNAWEWKSKPWGMSLESRTWGIIGCGRVGMAVARQLVPHRLEVLLHSPTGRNLKAEANNLNRLADSFDPGGAHFTVEDSLSTLLDRVDCLSIHVALNQDTRHLFGNDFFSAIRDGGVVVNTARGGVVNEREVVPHLLNRRIQYATDVLEVESSDEEASPLIGLPGFVGTPHIACFNDVLIRQTDQAMRNLVAVATGQTDSVCSFA